MDEKPEALRLAELLETDGWPDAAAELRRLHYLNQELLKALKLYGSACDATETTPCGYTEAQCCKRARAAIAKVEGI